MKRYNVISGSALTGAGAEIYEDEEGRFVKHSDVLAAIEQARKEEREACAKIADEWATDAQRKFGNGGPAAAPPCKVVELPERMEQHPQQEQAHELSEYEIGFNECLDEIKRRAK